MNESTASQRHLTEGQIMEAASAPLSGNPSEHLRSCPECRRRVDEWRRDAALIADLLAHPVAPLLTTGQPWRRQMAARFAEQPPRSSPHNLRFYAIAAALVLTVALPTAWWLAARHNDPARLLAEAYTAARPFEFRLPDAGYGRLTQQRGAGSTFDKPESLARAELALRQLQSASPNDPNVLLLTGRAELLENHFEAALDSLNRAAESSPGNAEILSDLGTAYAQRGDAEKRNIDLGHASELFLQALRKNPADQRTLFNLALVYEKLWLVDEAADTWRKLLALNPENGWRDEAETHLKNIEQIRERKRKADAGVVTDPAKFLATHSSGAPFDPLPWFTAFWTDWIPRNAEDPDAARAARVVAEAIHTQFHEASLAEALEHADTTQQELASLAAILKANREGHANLALAAAPETARRLDAAHLTGAALLARAEFAYAARFAARYQDCVDATEQVLRAGETKYAWIAGTAHLEHVSCIDRLGQPGRAREEADRTRVAMDRAGIWPVAYRAAVFVAGIDAKTGNYSPIWENVPSQLRTYWTTSGGIYRIQGGATYLEKAAELPGWRETAAVLYRAQIRYADRARNGEIAVSDHAGFARLLEASGHYDEEMQELNQVNSWLATQTGPVADNLRWDAELQRAEARIAAGHAREVGPAIDQLAAHSEGRAAEQLVRVDQARGLSLAASGDWQNATEALRLAIALNAKEAQTFPAWLDRMPVLETAAPAYKALTQIHLLREHNPAEGLATWNQLRPGSASITFAELPAGVVVWNNLDGAVKIRLVNEPAAAIHAAADRLLRLCASPHSNSEEIAATGRQLYRWLLAPELAHSKRNLISVSADSWLQSIPLGALTDDNGHFLARSFAFVETYGPTHPTAAQPIAAADPLLLISAPGQPPLSAAISEAAQISALFPNRLVSEISAAPQARIFHFTGHGWANGGNGALILPPGPEGEPRFLTAATLAKQNWSQCRLAVLSACLTATGEERGAVNNQSLVQALLSAGAWRVVAARWSVDSEATRVLMEAFYTRVLSGESVPKSLSDAEAEVANAPEWRHPYFWAGFDAFGTA